MDNLKRRQVDKIELPIPISCREVAGWPRRGVVALVAAVLVFVAGAAVALLEVVETTPPADSVLNQPARTLHVVFSQEPDLARSKLELEGPRGKLEVSGMHTMGNNDLMVRVSGAMPDGQYTARWQTAGSDGHVIEGEWKFEIKRASAPP